MAQHFIGGYKILDFDGIDVSNTAVIPGIYDRIEEVRGKPILIQNLVMPGTELAVNVYATPTIASGDFVLLLGTFIDEEKNVSIPALTITDDDEVTFSIITNETEDESEDGGVSV